MINKMAVIVKQRRPVDARLEQAESKMIFDDQWLEQRLCNKQTACGGNNEKRKVPSLPMVCKSRGRKQSAQGGIEEQRVTSWGGDMVKGLRADDADQDERWC
jgi:hypothetical protein